MMYPPYMARGMTDNPATASAVSTVFAKATTVRNQAIIVTVVRKMKAVNRKNAPISRMRLAMNYTMMVKASMFKTLMGY